MTLLVVFGSTPELAWQELIAVCPQAERISPHTAVIHDGTNSPEDLIQRLGGATRIARLASVTPSLDASTLAPILKLENFKSFGVSAVDLPPVSSTILAEIKEMLGRPARFLSGQLSAVVIEKQHVTECIVFPYRGKFGVAVTATVQPYEEWIRRDRGRPHADAKAGMLPPKVARIMVNLAGLPGTLLDPFCGMGTILAEALLLGWQALGSDLSAEVVKKAQANLDWLTPGKKKAKLFVSDATHVSETVSGVDAIVTEPFMGKPGASEKNVGDIVKGLEKLYIGCFKDWNRVLKSGGKLVIVLPKFEIQGKSYFVKKAIDSCETLGYTVLVGPIEYSRPRAQVRREIFVLKKK